MFLKFYIDFPFLLGADGTKIISPKTELLVPKYFYYYLRTIKLENPGYSRHYKYLKDKFIVIPPKSVQLKISEKLESIEKLIYYRRHEGTVSTTFRGSRPAGLIKTIGYKLNYVWGLISLLFKK